LACTSCRLCACRPQDENDVGFASCSCSPFIGYLSHNIWSTHFKAERNESHTPLDGACPGRASRVSLSRSTLAIWLHNKPYCFRFLGCPYDSLRVARLHRPEKSLQKVSKKSPKPSQAEIASSLLVRTRGERDTVPTGQLTNPANRPRSLGVAPFGALLWELGSRHRKERGVEPPSVGPL
jgi:hypothetical protein